MIFRKTINLKYLIFIILALNFIFLTDVYSAKKKKKHKQMKIGTVDLEKVFENSKKKKAADGKLEGKRKSFESGKDKKIEEIRKLKDDYENTKLSLTDAQKITSRDNIKKKVKELQEYIDKSKKELEKMEKEVLAPIIDEIQYAIKSVSLAKRFDLIIDKKTYILFIKPRYDITDDVIREITGDVKK